MALTGKMLAWADAWLESFNKTEASRVAGYAGNDVTLASIGYENFRKPQIQEYIKRRLDERGMPGDEVLMRYAEIARNDIAIFAEIKSPKDLLQEKYKGKTHLIKKLKARTYFDKRIGEEVTEVELEMYDAKSALDSLAKYHNLLKDTQVNYDVDLSTLSDEQLQRLADGEDLFTIMATQSQS